MCNKELAKDNEALLLYNSFQDKSLNNGKEKSLSFVLQFLLTPFYSNKKQIIDFLDVFDSFLLSYEDPITKYIFHETSFSNGEWKTNEVDYVLQTLPKLRFYCRFNQKQILQIMKLTKISLIPANEVFIVPKDKVYIILQGYILVKSYKQDLDVPEIVAKLTSGDVIGFNKDNGFSRDSENWMHPITNIEIAVYSYSDFEFIWEEQKSVKANIEVGKLSQNVAFAALSELTLYKIYQELMHIATYENGTPLCLQSKRSLLNYKSKILYSGLISSTLILPHNETKLAPEREFVDYIKKHSQANISLSKMAKEIRYTVTKHTRMRWDSYNTGWQMRYYKSK